MPKAKKQIITDDTSHITKIPELVPDFPDPDTTPTILVKFTHMQFPEFEFKNWKAGISLGAIERAGQLMIREVQREQARLLTQSRTTDESEPD